MLSSKMMSVASMLLSDSRLRRISTEKGYLLPNVSSSEFFCSLSFKAVPDFAASKVNKQRLIANSPKNPSKEWLVLIAVKVLCSALRSSS